MKLHILSCLLLPLLVAGGCVRSIQPVLKDEQVISDDSVLGKWVSENGEDHAVISPGEPGKSYKVVHTDKENKTGRYVMRLGKVGDLLIAEFCPEDPESDANATYRAHLIPVYSFLVVEQTKPNAVFRLLAPEWFKKYVEAHPGELQVTARGKDDLIVTASTADYQAFILKHWKDPEAASDKTTFVRASDASTQPSPPK